MRSSLGAPHSTERVQRYNKLSTPPNISSFYCRFADQKAPDAFLDSHLTPFCLCQTNMEKNDNNFNENVSPKNHKHFCFEFVELTFFTKLLFPTT